MSDISTFDHFPTEIFLCIFRYLSAAEKFRAFFDYNDRLRKIVKRYVTYSRKSLNKDIKQFAVSYSYDRHSKFVVDDNAPFYLIPCKSKQMRNNFNPRLSDYFDVQWHFCRQYPVPILDERIQEIIHEYPIKLKSNFHPDKEQFAKDFKNVFSLHDPQHDDALAKLMCGGRNKIDDSSIGLKHIDENKSKCLIDIIREAADHIWKKLQKLEDLNTLEIEYNS